MSDAAHIHPYPTREDAYFHVLEAFMRTSAGYLDVEHRLPETGVPRQWHEHATPAATLR
jgi:hypothetical protein